MPVKNKTGFSLIELLVSILLTSIVMLAIYSVYRVQTHSVKVQEGNLEAQEYARAVLDMMVREIRNVGYFPVANCGAPANVGGVISPVARQTFAFVYDGNDNGSCSDANEWITYSFTTDNCPSGYGNITRQEGSNTAQALTDCNVPADPTNFSFVYFPRQTGGTAPPPYCYPSTSLPAGCAGDAGANLANIQRISISITVQSKWSDTEFGGKALTTVSSNSDLRNRG